MAKKKEGSFKLNITLRDYVNQLDEEVVFTAEQVQDEGEALELAKKELETKTKKIVSSCVAP